MQFKKGRPSYDRVSHEANTSCDGVLYEGVVSYDGYYNEMLIAGGKLLGPGKWVSRVKQKQIRVLDRCLHAIIIFRQTRKVCNKQFYKKNTK